MTIKPKVLVAYVSYGGNARLMADHAFTAIRKQADVDLYRVEDFPISSLNDYTHLCLVTLTWGKGNLPSEWIETGFLEELKNTDPKRVVVLGTGDDVYGDNFNRATEIIAAYCSEKHQVIGKLRMLLKPKVAKDYERIERISDALLNKVVE